MRLPFITGSRAYGSPTEKSDTDIVVLLTDDDTQLFGLELLGDYPDQETLRIADLNIIVVRHPLAYDSWLAATKRMIGWREQGYPVPREVAKNEITKDYNFRGIGYLREPGGAISNEKGKIAHVKEFTNESEVCNDDVPF